MMQFENVFYYFLLVCALPATQSVQINVKGRMKVGQGAATLLNQLSEYLNRNRLQSEFQSNTELPEHIEPVFVKQDVKDWLDRQHLINKKQSEELSDPLFTKDAYKKWLASQYSGLEKEGMWWMDKKHPIRQQIEPNSEQPVQVFGNAEQKKWVDVPINYKDDALRQTNDWGHLHVYGSHGKKGKNIVDVRRYIIYKDDSYK